MWVRFVSGGMLMSKRCRVTYLCSGTRLCSSKRVYRARQTNAMRDLYVHMVLPAMGWSAISTSGEDSRSEDIHVEKKKQKNKKTMKKKTPILYHFPVNSETCDHIL